MQVGALLCYCQLVGGRLHFCCWLNNGSPARHRICLLLIALAASASVQGLRWNAGLIQLDLSVGLLKCLYVERDARANHVW